MKFLDKSVLLIKPKSLPATIKKSNLLHFATNHIEKAGDKKDQTKYVSQAQRSMDIAKSAYIRTSEMVQCDLLDSLSSFNGDFPVKLSKKNLKV